MNRRSGRRGPRAKLSVEVLAQAAIQLAEAHGLEALSIQRIATALGYTTMSIDNHISSKDLLLEVMVDVAADEPYVAAEALDASGRVLAPAER